jgi:hypothetical protein
VLSYYASNLVEESLDVPTVLAPIETPERQDTISSPHDQELAQMRAVNLFPKDEELCHPKLRRVSLTTPDKCC